jgi:predicted CXXCH cytochrome family protein
MKSARKPLAWLSRALFVAAACVLPALAQNKPCLECHAALTQKKVVHPAVQMGCESCHAEIDASTLPHKSKGKSTKGLLAEAPALCANCHDKQLFEGKVVHGPVAAGMCLGCHNPHASDYLGLLKKEPATLCLDCHPDIKKGPHVIAGFTRSGHPLGNEAKEVQDPLRPGKKFYCAGCHEPHRSELPKLSRYGKGMASCQKCHNK